MAALFDLNKIESNTFVQLLILNILQVLKLEIYGSMGSMEKITKWMKVSIFENLSLLDMIRKLSSIRMLDQSNGSESHISTVIIMSCQ